MKVTFVASIALLALVSIGSTIKEKERFAGQALLEECLEEIPFSYSTKKKGPFMEAVNRLEGLELALVTAIGKLTTYQFYYFETFDAVDGESAYLISPEEFTGETKEHSSLFLGYKKKKHFFYRADCFRKKLAANPSLNETLQKQNYTSL